jgi:hypothetical protein
VWNAAPTVKEVWHEFARFADIRIAWLRLPATWMCMHVKGSHLMISYMLQDVTERFCANDGAISLIIHVL